MRHSVVTVRRLELPVREGTLPWDATRPYDTVAIVLDGKELADWLAPPARPGSEPPAYLGRHVSTDMTGLLLGMAAEPQDEGRTALLTCTCTDVGCGGLLARIDVGTDAVTWSGFARAGDPVPPCEDLELRFDRAMYVAALADLERRLG